MKVLFAVNNENISESIIKKYQQEYKEIISVKNVYYFNAIVKELQRDKTYDRIVISEDLQSFSNNNYAEIDRFIFEKMDDISDEATNESGNDIPIILICTDRRTKSEPLLVKLFGIGVYNALIGKDRSITNVCELLARPRTKKEAKAYYKIDSEDVDYKVENAGDVSEVEIQNILNHYKKLGSNEQKYVESFDHIASQYNEAQLRLIAKCLPLNVRAVLEANSPVYQQVVSLGRATPKLSQKPPTNYNDYEKKNTFAKSAKTKNEPKNKNSEPELDFIQKNIQQNKLTQPVVIPSAINTANVKKVQQEPLDMVLPGLDDDELVEQVPTAIEKPEVKEEVVAPKRRGRPKKIKPEEQAENTQPKKGRGRPKKQQVEEQEPIIENKQEKEDMILPGLDDETLYMEEPTLGEMKEEPVMEVPSYQEPEQNLAGQMLESQQSLGEPIQRPQQNLGAPILGKQQTAIENTQKHEFSHADLSGLLTQDKKVVAFVGTSKNGTSFLVNNVAEILSQRGINTAILDLTQNKNAYYIYTENEESLRQTAYSCIDNLRRGNANGIQVHKNLTVYTTVPGENQDIQDYTNILQTLIQNYSLVILDCDFETNYGYFKEAQELYLVQSLDVLTIQPLTAFLRNLKAKNALNPEKIRIVLNKVVKLRSISEKTIIGGMAYYNDPAMSFMTELFNKDSVPYCVIPFEEQTYSKYLEGLINCKITLNGYTKNFMETLSRLADTVYPLINQKSTKLGGYNNYQTRNNFSSSMNNTLNKMKNNYEL